MTDTEAVIGALHRWFTRRRLSFVDEATIQGFVEQALTANQLEYEREHLLSAEDKPDFFVRGNVVLEVKLAQPAIQVNRQLLRYAAHEAVKVLVLVNVRPFGIEQLPRQLHQKPVRQFSLWPYCV